VCGKAIGKAYLPDGRDISCGDVKLPSPNLPLLVEQKFD